jgi:hypothetical protein
MICNLTIGATVVELAGGLGRTSETSGLRIDVQPSFERVAYIGVNEARQYARPGASISVSFDSSQTFASLALAQAYILGLPSDLINQTSATAVIGQEVPTMVVTGTLSPAAGGTYTFREIFNGKPVYEKGIYGAVGYSYISWDSGALKWLLIRVDVLSPLAISIWESSSNVATPDLAAVWTPVSPATGTPVFTAGTTITPSLTIYDAEAIVSAAHQGATVRLSVSISGRITSP